jgi:RNA polymerase sigma factor (sigma-70 family)
MYQATACNLPASLRGMLDELASAEATSSQGWILAMLKQHAPAVVSVLWRMLRHEEDVRDAYQTVVCQFAARGPKRVGRNRAAYFYRSAVNAGIEVIRRRRREHDRLPQVADRCGRRATAPDLVTAADRVHAVERMRAAVLSLPGQLRDVIVLRELAGLDYRRVSSIVKISSGTARVYRRQAVVRLAAGLAREEVA